ncbi:MAG: hypothetical protein GY788_24395 [bacterium]|nr:hypothetical protein [bacterium]
MHPSDVDRDDTTVILPRVLRVRGTMRSMVVGADADDCHSVPVADGGQRGLKSPLCNLMALVWYVGSGNPRRFDPTFVKSEKPKPSLARFRRPLHHRFATVPLPQEIGGGWVHPSDVDRDDTTVILPRVLRGRGTMRSMVVGAGKRCGTRTSASADDANTRSQAKTHAHYPAANRGCSG